VNKCAQKLIPNVGAHVSLGHVVHGVLYKKALGRQIKMVGF